MHEAAVLMQMGEPMATSSVIQSAEAPNYIKCMRFQSRGIPRSATICRTFSRFSNA